MTKKSKIKWPAQTKAAAVTYCTGKVGLQGTNVTYILFMNVLCTKVRLFYLKIQLAVFF